MSDILYHSVQQRARLLADRLRLALAGIDHPQARTLAERVDPTAHARPRLVFTGQYSSGKSSLIKALTDGVAAVHIDSDIATDVVTEYDWDGLVTLVDTPGVQAGVVRHDELAESAITAADLVLFAITPDLFDNAGVAHLRHVINDLRKANQMLVVLNKCNTMAAADGVVRPQSARPSARMHLKCRWSSATPGITWTAWPRSTPGAGRVSRPVQPQRAARQHQRDKRQNR